MKYPKRQGDSLTRTGLNIDLDGIDTIYTHPNNIPLLEKEFKKVSDKVHSFISFSRGISIVAAPYMDRFIKASSDNAYVVWRRTNVLPDTKLVQYVDDIEKPTSWQIYFGLVESVTPYFLATKRSAVYAVNTIPMEKNFIPSPRRKKIDYGN
jgi:hypothetical protein